MTASGALQVGPSMAILDDPDAAFAEQGVDAAGVMTSGGDGHEGWSSDFLSTGPGGNGYGLVGPVRSIHSRRPSVGPTGDDTWPLASSRENRRRKRTAGLSSGSCVLLE